MVCSRTTAQEKSFQEVLPLTRQMDQLSPKDGHAVSYLLEKPGMRRDGRGAFPSEAVGQTCRRAGSNAGMTGFRLPYCRVTDHVKRDRILHLETR